jgi:hypothetical protein
MRLMFSKIISKESFARGSKEMGIGGCLSLLASASIQQALSCWAMKRMARAWNLLLLRLIFVYKRNKVTVQSLF